MTHRHPRIRVGRRTMLAAAGALALPFPAIHARAQAAGVALVIGNSRYQWEASLPNVQRDVRDVAQRFQAFGLRTELIQDVGRDAMLRAIDGFSAACRGAAFAAFYFAGHGATWENHTYVVPQDADLANPSAAEKMLIGLPAIKTAMGAAGRRFMALDSCRNNPADGWRQQVAEFSASQGTGSSDRSSPNTLVLFSTAPGRVAVDGPAGDNSPFAASLLRQLSGSVDLPSLPGTMRRDLLIATQGRQVLWDQNTYQQPFVLSGPAARGAAVRSSWSDPSKIIELPNAYAYAQQNGLPMPAGLIAYRATSDSRNSQKVGSFKFVGEGNRPFMLIVMSVEDQTSAQIVFVYSRQGGNFWRFVRGDLSGDNLEFLPQYVRSRFQFHWNDANGGSVTMYVPKQGGGRPAYNERFTRLDG